MPAGLAVAELPKRFEEDVGAVVVGAPNEKVGFVDGVSPIVEAQSKELLDVSRCCQLHS